MRAVAEHDSGPVHPDMARLAFSVPLHCPRQGTMAAKSPETSKFHGDRAQIRGRRVHRDTFVRRPFVVGRVERSPSQSLDAVYFDTPGPRSGPPPDHACGAAPAGRTRGGTSNCLQAPTPAPRCGCRWRTTGPPNPTPPACRKAFATWCSRSCATARSRRWPGSARPGRVEMLYGPEGSAVAEFCDDQVTASAVGRRRAAVARMGTGAGSRGGPTSDCWTGWQPAAGRGRAPAGHGSKLARVLSRAERRRTCTEASRRPRAPGVAKQSTSCWCGTARFGPTCPTRCIRCG